jgi:preprotein translocase subunit YajC
MIVAAINGGLFIVVAGFALVYVLFLRPQQARQRAAREQGNTISPGDEVLTVGGLYGIVQELDEEGDLIVEIAEGIHVRIARRAVATVVKPEDEDDEVDEEHHDEGDPEPDAADESSADHSPPAA